MLATGPKFSGSNPTEVTDFSGQKKIRNTLSFGGEVKSSAPCCEIFSMLKYLACYDRDTMPANFKDTSRHFHASLLYVSATTRQHWWMKQE
jgi:hypothetical protein